MQQLFIIGKASALTQGWESRYGAESATHRPLYV
jgi:hypothetical protein